MQNNISETRSHAGELEKRMPVVAHQLDRFFRLQSQSFRERHASEDLLITWAQRFSERFLLARVDRADDLEKPGVKLAQQLVREFFGPTNFNYVVDCMDGRNMPAVETSHPAHEGGVMRTAAGDFEVFPDGSKPGSVVVDMNSFKAQAIVRLLRTRVGKNIHYSWDSHVGCAARGGAETVAGSVTEDDGLAEDIKRKIALTNGVLQIRDMLSQKEKVANIFPAFYTYDPHDGTMTMGLEMHVHSAGEKGLTPAVRARLASEGKIVETWQFLRDGAIAGQLKKFVQPADFRNRYAETMGSNWQAITALYDKGNGPVYQKILLALKQAYAKSHSKISAEVLENKAKLMLKNLVTRWSIATDKHEWPFDKHKEQGIVFTEGGYAPFREIDVFSIFSRGEIRNNTYLALGIVRNARRSGAIVDPVGMLSGNDFVRAPIMMMNKAIIRHMSEEGWKTLERIDVQKMVGRINWYDTKQMRAWNRSNTETQILETLVHSNLSFKPNDLVIFIDGVYEVFDRMRTLMLDPRFRPMMIKGQVMAVNLLVDNNRRARMVVPFVI